MLHHFCCDRRCPLAPLHGPRLAVAARARAPRASPPFSGPSPPQFAALKRRFAVKMPAVAAQNLLASAHVIEYMAIQRKVPRPATGPGSAPGAGAGAP